MTDFNTHILPRIDDGSSSLRVSLQMLAEESKQGVDRIVLTPHFNPKNESAERFLRRRDSAVEFLRTVYDPASHPTVHVGTELVYSGPVTSASMLDDLCIVGTNVLLLEMPYRIWRESVIEDLTYMVSLGIVPVIAHYDRYVQDREVFEYLQGEGVVFQFGAAHFSSGLFKNRKALRSVRSGEAGVLGSGCCNMTNRPPDMAGAIELIRNRLGQEALYELEDRADRLLHGAFMLTPAPTGDIR